MTLKELCTIRGYNTYITDCVVNERWHAPVPDNYYSDVLDYVIDDLAQEIKSCMWLLPGDGRDLEDVEDDPEWQENPLLYIDEETKAYLDKINTLAEWFLEEYQLNY